MEQIDRLKKAGLAINRLNLNSARMVYCKRFDDRKAPFEKKSATSSEINKENKCEKWNFTKHFHDFMELIYFIDGQASIRGDKSEYVVSPYDIVIYPDGIKHQEMLSLYKHQEIICLGVRFSNPSNLETILSIKDNDNRLKWIFQEIHKQHCLEEKRNVDIVYNLLKLLFLYIQQLLEKGDDLTTTRIEHAICYIRENFHNPITIKELAEFINVSPTFLNKLFKKETGTTPINYVNLVRLEIARQLLIDQDMTVNMVCERVGIEDPKYFSRLFKKIEGLSPSEYRNSNLQSPKFKRN